MNEETPHIAQHFRINLVLPKDEAKDRKWSRNAYLGIVAKDCQLALAKALEIHPDGELQSIHSQGKVHVVLS